MIHYDHDMMHCAQDQCNGCNNIKGCVTCKDGSEWAHYEEPTSNDLEEAAKKVGQKYFPNEYNIWARPNYEAVKVECAFKAGAQWQKERVIDKACEWLKSYRQDTPDGTGYVAGIVNDKTIEELKQAIEE